ncbi:hypothetical protein N5923_21720 [Erwiniaceae bacterium BAC15a-03b]|uniref:Baseplate structural protein Gp10 C-terminal domain-containing protein n=1 Tax=Winslowiella arboricola TaxID=2978220 RepID=A0A9J6PRN4_9GAMM|nr:hypothetical protein [Winslowiella arboricola]MCU5774734.1 hypothetical protein [Winslowiella arboricola]MCU5780114.1 hypothetical protein [Winslowiella arboricola]
MITGFGNNVVSSLASDITAAQTTFAVMPGTGELFARLLTTDIANPDSPHNIYAKLTLTDAQQSVFEICHLMAVSQDTLTVIRGQEETTAKGWSLNDAVANFATRGSEQNYVQIEQLQAGDFTTATAGGTANALTVSLPSTYFNNSGTEWQLKTPLIITPTAANTGGATLQVTLSGIVLGTFPLYKGHKRELDTGDLVSGVPFCCVLDQTKEFFNVINPTALYNYSVDQMYPVGIVIWFAQNKNPNLLFPGTTWVYIGENRVIRTAKADGTDILASGGADVVTLVPGNLPAHSHSFSANTSSFDYGTKTSSSFDYGTKTSNSAGAHTHNAWQFTLDGAVQSYRISLHDRWFGNNLTATNSAGAHTHTVVIGAHTHTVAIGAHSHSVSGSTESTGSGTALSVVNAYVKLMGWYRTA